MVKSMKDINAVLMVVGTAIGAGMLGMPVESGLSGALPSVCCLLFAWVATLMSALLFADVLCHSDVGDNYVTISERLLGKHTKMITLAIYLLLFISLVFAYVKGIGIFLVGMLNLSHVWQGALLFFCVVVPFIIFGMKLAAKLNAILVGALAISFVCLISLGITETKINLLQYSNWSLGFLSLPLLLTTFGFHIVIPSLTKYLDNNRIQIRKVLILGSVLIFAIYLIWQLFVISIIPQSGEQSLAHALANDLTAVTPLIHHVHNVWISYFAQILYFSAVTTSFIGTTISLIDFIADAFRLQHSWSSKSLIIMLIFIPALLLSGTDLRIFYLSLKYGAGFACVFLLLLLPVLYASRISKNLSIVTNSTNVQVNAFSSFTLFASVVVTFTSAVLSAQIIGIMR